MKTIEIHPSDFFVMCLNERVPGNFSHVAATMTNTLERRGAQVGKYAGPVHREYPDDRRTK